MTTSSTYQILQGNDEIALVDALSNLWHADASLSRSDIPLLLRLLWHGSSDVRLETVRVIGLHWRLPVSYRHLAAMLEFAERDQRVKRALSAALSSLIVSGIGDGDKISRIYAKFILKNSIDPELRNQAYVDLLQIWQKVNAAEYHSMRSRDYIEIDKHWLRKFITSDVESVSELSAVNQFGAISARLASASRREIYLCLCELKRSDCIESRFVRDQLIELLTHSDSDIRAGVVELLGLHWKLDEVFFRLIEMLTLRERDTEVCLCLISSIASLVRAGCGKLVDVVAGLVAIASCKNCDPRLRAFANFDVLTLAGLLDSETLAFNSDWRMVSAIPIDESRLQTATATSLRDLLDLR